MTNLTDSFVLPDSADTIDPRNHLSLGNRRRGEIGPHNELRRALARLRFNWYDNPYARAQLKITTPTDRNLFLILPGHRDSTFDRNISWRMRVSFVRLTDANGDYRVEIPSLENWGERDLISDTSYRISREFGRKNPKAAPYNWMIPKYRYEFLAAFADERQATQIAPIVLELPSDWTENKIEPNPEILTAGCSAGFKLAMAPYEKDTLDVSPTFGQYKYGIICNPDKLPIVEVVRVGKAAKDTRYDITIHNTNTRLNNRALFGEHFKPIEKVLNKPTREYLVEILRLKLGHDDIQKFCPEILKATVPGVELPARAPAQAPVTQPVAQAPAANQLPPPVIPTTAPVVPTPAPTPTPVVQAQPQPAAIQSPAPPKAVQPPAQVTLSPPVQPPVATVPAPLPVAFAPAPAGGGIAPFQAAETGMTHPLPPGTRVRFSTSTMPNGTLVSLVKTLNQSELPYFATAQDDGTNLYQTLVQSGNADRLKQWAPYVVAI